MSLTEICSRKPIKDLCYFKKSHFELWGVPLFWWLKMVELLALPVAIFTTTHLGIPQYNSENKTLVWWPQLAKELAGGDGYKYRFKPKAVPSIVPHMETKRPVYRVRSVLRNSTSSRASWLASTCLHPNRWHLGFLVSAVCKLFQKLWSTKRLKGIRAKVERERSGSLGSFIHPQASLFSSSYRLLLLLPFDWKLQPKATQCGIIWVFDFLSCVVVKAKVYRSKCQ